jgi:16S rRNA (cytidine1402-2'-O)-methyltransferase
MSVKKPAQRKEKSSPDYPSVGRLILQASRDGAPSKLPPGLYIVATPIGNLGDISLRALVTLAGSDHVACEDTRVGGGLLARYGIKKPLLPYHDHNADKARPDILQKLAIGESIALISDAGMPLVADPGFKLVRDCRKEGHAVTVIPGANAALTGLIGSGLPVEPFYFAGFLPAKSAARRKMLQALAAQPATLLFYEAPQRLAATLNDLAEILGSERPAAVARELTKLFEETKTGTLSELATFYKAAPVKGEITIIVGPSEADETAINPAQLDAMLKQELRTQSLRNAVMQVSIATGMPKSEVYARALALQKKIP